MKVTKLSDAEAAFSGFTHKVNISFANGDFTAAALTQTYTPLTTTAGQRIKDAAIRLITPVAGGAIATASATFGKTGTANQYITATDVFTASAIVTKAGDGAGFNQGPGEGFAAAVALIIVLTTTTGNVVAATAGEFNVYFSLADITRV